MGVKDLNNLVSEFPKVESDFRNYENILIDCSNVIVTFIFRYFGKLQKTDSLNLGKYTINTSKTQQLILLPVNEQINELTDSIIKDIKLMLDKCIDEFDELQRIYIISDPNTEYDYKFINNEELCLNCVDNDMFNEWIKRNKFMYDENNVISFSSKEDERKLRVQQQQTIKPITIIDNETNETIIIDDYDVFKNNDNNDLYKILYHFTYFQKRSRLMSLIPYIQHLIIELVKSEDYNDIVEYYRSNTEADIFMKAFYNDVLNKETKTLIISNDTDYDILFGEYINVDTMTVSNFNFDNIVNPYSYWYDLFHVNDIILFRLILARLSALFGNDYTCHDRKVVASLKFVHYLPILFNLGEFNYESIDLKKNTSLGKLKVNMIKQAIVVNQKRELMKTELRSLDRELEKVKYETLAKQYKLTKHFKTLDSSIYNSITNEKDLKYFNGYYETLLIYLNFKIYNKYENMKEIEIEYKLPDLGYELKIGETKIDVI